MEKILAWEKHWGAYVDALAERDKLRNSGAKRRVVKGAALRAARAWYRMVRWGAENNVGVPKALWRE